MKNLNHRLALVIGNAAYAKPLKTPGNDADAMTAALQRAGFQVTTRKNLRLGEMKAAINDFGARLNRNTIGLVYFAGHGVQAEDSRNYLLPIGADTDIIKSAQLPDGAVSLGFIRGAMDGGGLNLIFLDACREAPYAFTRGNGKRGLVPVTGGSDDILIAYATAAGDSADDSDAYGSNSPYTASLIKWMAEPLPIEILLKKVRADVMRQTHGSQRPIYNPEFTQDFYFTAPTAGKEPAVAPDVEAILLEAQEAYEECDYERARRLWQPLAEAGNSAAQNGLGDLYRLGKSVKQDYDKAYEWYEKAAAQGDADAQFSLGIFYEDGEGVEQDYDKAREWWEKAAAQGHADAQYELGVLYEKGRGVEWDYGKAREWYEEAADQGHADAQYKLGVLYEDGEGVERDHDKAHERYEEAAANGNADAQYKLGVLYEEGRGVEQDDDKAREWYEEAAANWNPDAQYKLGVLYEEGRKVERDYDKAREWWKKAAAQGHADAQYNLGVLYEEGLGVERDYGKAREWYKKAAWWNADAQYRLGVLYELGWGVERDDDEAYEWYQKAAAAGNILARDALERLD